MEVLEDPYKFLVCYCLYRGNEDNVSVLILEQIDDIGEDSIRALL